MAYGQLVPQASIERVMTAVRGAASLLTLSKQKNPWHNSKVAMGHDIHLILINEVLGF